MANINRFKAFEKVGKSVATNVDFDKVIGDSPRRTSDDIIAASRDLNLPLDQLKNALFWLVSTTPAEEIAMRNLSAGNLEKARSIVEKFATWSAFLNYHTMSLMSGDLAGAARAITAIIGRYRQQLLDGLALDTVNISESEFIQLYYDLISKDYSSADILSAFKNTATGSANAYDVILDRVCKDYATRIDNLISIAEATPKSDPESNRLAGLTLKRKSESILSEFKAIAYGNSGYTIIADKLALQVLQNGIHYYNNTEDEDAARRGMPLFTFARHIAVGPLARERCDDNYEILKKAYDELPPIEAVVDIKAIERILGSFGSNTASATRSKELVLKCAPYLGNLKEKCGLSHPAVITISTRIVRKALNSVIADVNAAIQRVDNATSYARVAELSKAKDVLADAWDATLHLDQLPLLEEAKDWYSGNCKRLIELMNDAEVPTMRFGTFRIKTEPEYFQGCRTKADYQEYLKLYPDARYLAIAKKRIAEFERLEEIERKRREEIERKRREERERQEEIERKRREEIERKRREERERQEEIERKRREEIERKRREGRDRVLTAIHAATELKQLWTLHPHCKDTSTLSALDNKAWSLCKKRSDYKEYISHLPKGQHTTDAEKKSQHVFAKIGDFFKNNTEWFIIIAIILVISLPVWAFWGYTCILICLCVVGGISALLSWEGLNSVDKNSRAMFFVGGLIALLCFGGAFFIYETVSDDEEIWKERSLVDKEEEIRMERMLADKEEEIRKERSLADKEEAVYNTFLNNPDTDNFKAYIKDFRYGRYIDEVATTYLETIKSQGPLALNNFALEYPVLGKELDVADIIAQQCDSLYSVALGRNTRKAWENYQKAVPTNHWRDSQNRIEAMSRAGNYVKNKDRINSSMNYNYE